MHEKIIKNINYNIYIYRFNAKFVTTYIQYNQVYIYAYIRIFVLK